MSETRIDESGFVAGQDRIGTSAEMLAGLGGQENPGPLSKDWRKASFSNGSGGNNCVEVRRSGVEDWVLVRNSKDPQGGVLAFTTDEWTAFLAGVGAGEFNL